MRKLFIIILVLVCFVGCSETKNPILHSVTGSIETIEFYQGSFSSSTKFSVMFDDGRFYMFYGVPNGVAKGRKVKIYYEYYKSRAYGTLFCFHSAEIVGSYE